jgi:hypothetical protein
VPAIAGLILVEVNRPRNIFGVFLPRHRQFGRQDQWRNLLKFLKAAPAIPQCHSNDHQLAASTVNRERQDFMLPATTTYNTRIFRAAANLKQISLEFQPAAAWL